VKRSAKQTMETAVVSAALQTTCGMASSQSSNGAASEGKAGGGRFRQREKGLSHAKAFRQWLVRTIGVVELCKGSGVLDVAGGKGQLSFELLNLKDVPTTVIDPRPLNVAKYCESFRMGHYGRQPEDAAPRAPRHIQRFWEPALWAPHSTLPCPVRQQLKETWERAHGAELQRLERTGERAKSGAGASGVGRVPEDAEGSTRCPEQVQNISHVPAASKKEKVKPKYRGVFFDAAAADGKGAFVACIRSGVYSCAAHHSALLWHPLTITD
jgi:hypothetical protein